jgi:hypothetical protein
MIPFDTQQSFVYIGVLVTSYRHNAALFDAHLNVAARPAESTRSFIPNDAIVPLRGLVGLNYR